MSVSIWMKRQLAIEGHSGETISAAARMGEISRVSNVLLFSITGAFIALAVWASRADLVTVAAAQGKVIPSAKVQMVESLEGGIVRAVHVKQGQRVEPGTLLVSLSPTQASGDFQTRRQQSWSLAARIARLQAEAEGREPDFSQLSKGGLEFARAERAAFDSRRIEHAAQSSMLDSQILQKEKELEDSQVAITTAKRTLVTARDERQMLEKLVAQGLEPRIELVRLERTMAESEGRLASAQVAIGRIQGAIDETRSRRDSVRQQFRAMARDELNKAIGELRALEQGMPALEDRFDRTALKSPVRAVVNRVFVNSVGGVAKPGEPLVELVPADDQLVVEAMVNPKDIGFIKMGQDAKVKLTAYDYAIYGSLPGKVSQVGADAITNERGESYFLVRIETDQKTVESLDRKLPIISGMQAQVDIVTGQKTVMEYIVKPLIGVRENAFRER